MKRYLVFCYDRYYPWGGIEDFITSYDTLEEAKAHQKQEGTYRTYQIVDQQNLDVYLESTDEDSGYGRTEWSDWSEKKREISHEA